jgi:thiamine-phosphate pyrophosphorylase
MIDRIIDANGNRVAEGLRVLEEVARFLIEHGELSARAKDLRHCLRSAIPVDAIVARDTAGDIGSVITAADEQHRPALRDVIRANAARATEALRSLEEFGKLAGAPDPVIMERLRYGAYDLERDLLACLSAQRLWQEKLYLLIDTNCAEEPMAVARQAVAGGVGIVQLRAKGLSVRDYAELAIAMQAAVRAAGGLFIVNDHVAIAAAIRADGVHIGQDDLSPAQARRVLGPLALIGLSTHTPTQVTEAHRQPIDYIGIGPMFTTTTKPHEAVQGPDLLQAVRAGLRLPSYAIGGIDPTNMATLLPPHGIAVAGCVCRASDPAAVCRQLRQQLDAPA